jgi:hypothetical protein
VNATHYVCELPFVTRFWVFFCGFYYENGGFYYENGVFYYENGGFTMKNTFFGDF